MVLDPRKHDRFDWAGSLFFFIIAILVIALGALLEKLHGMDRLPVNGGGLVGLLLVLLVYFLARLRAALR